jgi:ornithine decarboxylase
MQTETVALPHVMCPSWSMEIDLVDRPTPFLMVDIEKVIDAYSSLEAALPNFRIHYALKANPQPEILDALVQQGSGFEVASAAELQNLLDRDIRTDNVLFSNAVKVPLDIRRGYDCGVSAFALDSDAEIVKLALEAPGSAVYVRLATTGSASRFPLSRRFGVGPREAVELLKLARNFGLVPYGCTFHVGSQNTDPRSWDKPIEDCAHVMREFERLHGSRLQMLDIGGGFPAQYAEKLVPSLEEFGSYIARALTCLPYPVELVTEPGRVLVANAGVVATTVIGRRKRGPMTWVHLDVGPYNGLMEANSFLGGERNPISWSPTPNGGRTSPCTLTGPTCDDGDVLQEDVELPSDLGLGDRVYIGTAGAYSSSLAVNFNGFPPPQSIVKNVGEIASQQTTNAPGAGRRRLPVSGWSRESLGLAAVLMSALLWAVSANVAESLYATGLTALQVAGAETAIAASFLFAWRFRRDTGEARTTLPIRQRLLLGSSLTLMVCTYYGAIELLDVGTAVVLHYSAPVLVVLWTLLRTKQPPKVRVLLSLGLGALGILLVTQLVVSGFGALNPAGIVTALASAVFLAVYTLASDAAMRTATPVDVVTETFLWAAPLSVVAFFLGGSPITIFSVSSIGPVLFVGVFGALLGTSLYIWGVDRVHSVKASIAANLEPVAASVLAWLWFGQVLSPLQVFGALLILGAVALLRDSAPTSPTSSSSSNVRRDGGPPRYAAPPDLRAVPRRARATGDAAHDLERVHGLPLPSSLPPSA